MGLMTSLIACACARFLLLAPGGIAVAIQRLWVARDGLPSPRAAQHTDWCIVVEDVAEEVVEAEELYLRRKTHSASLCNGSHSGTRQIARVRTCRVYT